METLREGNVRTSGLEWFETPEPLAGTARVVMTTRKGGASRSPYDSLNLGFHVGDVEERVRMNRRALRRALPRGLREPVVGEQVHGAAARPVGELHAGSNWTGREPCLAATDALVTAVPRLPMVILTADCLPLALVDPVRGAAAAVHAGWRGLAGGVIEGALECMAQTWGSPPADLIAWIGPGIGPCCYRVGPEVAEQFPGCASPAGGSWTLDLRAGARARLSAAGLLQENLTGLPLCTSCRPDLFFSHRRARGEGAPATGRQAMLLWLE